MLFEALRGVTAMRTSKTSSRGGEFGLHVSEFTAVRELTAVRRARGEIDSAELKAHTAVVQSAFDATDASLKARRFKGVTGTPLAPAALEQRPLLTETPEELIYLRVKEGSKEIASRRGIPATSETTYLELTNLAVMCYLTANDWERLEPLPMIAETFVDHNETERSKITMPMTGRAAANVNKYVRVTITSARAPVIVRRTVNETLMAADRASRSVPRKYVQVGVKELHYPEKLFNEMVEQLVSLELGVHRSDVDALTNFMKALLVRKRRRLCQRHAPRPPVLPPPRRRRHAPHRIPARCSLSACRVSTRSPRSPVARSARAASSQPPSRRRP